MTYHLQAALDSEIKKRINHDSPTKYDIDFYQRKINRLESDNNDIHEELSKLRVRLRRAYDYELKYELVLKQLCTLQSDIDFKDKQLADMKSKAYQLQITTKYKYTKQTNWYSKLLELQLYVNRWKYRAYYAYQSKLQLVMYIKDKQTVEVKREVEQSRREFNDKEEEYMFQIRSLRKIVDEKQSVEGVVKGRIEKVRLYKDEEIGRLRGMMEQIKAECKQSVEEKNQYIEQLKEKFEKLFNFYLENIHKSQEDESELFGIEMNGLRELIGIKNDEIQRLLRYLRDSNDYHDKYRQYTNEEMIILRYQLYKMERENELELYGMKERLSKIHSQDIQYMYTRYQSMIDKLKLYRKEVELFLAEKDKIIEDGSKEMERIKADYIDRLKEREARIEQLMDRIKTSGEMNESEVKNLHHSFHKIESYKYLMSTEYQANVGFLNTQIAKQSAMNDSKNYQIKKLHYYMSRIKKYHNAMILYMEGRWKYYRREWQYSKDDDRKKYEELYYKIRGKYREWKSKEKQLQREIDKHQRENSKLQFIIKYMYTDTYRLNQYIKQIDDQLKREYKKNQLGSLDNAGIRRELTAELDRQKNELDAIMRMEVDKEKKRVDVEMMRLKNYNYRLQTYMVKKTILCENLEDELKKLQSLNKSIEIINKEKLIEYEKKMATLNQEINLTQNLYQAFMETKTRKVSGGN